MSADDEWRMAIGRDSGVPLVCRIRNKAPSYATKVAFPHLVTAVWNFQSSNETGMPSEPIVELMSLFEDLLVKTLEGACQAFLTVVATGNGVREWQWYSRDPEETLQLVNQALSENDPFPVQFCIDNDPEWVAFSQFGDHA